MRPARLPDGVGSSSDDPLNEVTVAVGRVTAGEECVLLAARLRLPYVTEVCLRCRGEVRSMFGMGRAVHAAGLCSA